MPTETSSTTAKGNLKSRVQSKQRPSATLLSSGGPLCQEIEIHLNRWLLIN